VIRLIDDLKAYVGSHAPFDLPAGGGAAGDFTRSGHVVRACPQPTRRPRGGPRLIIGTALGGMVHVVAAALGLSVFLARSASAFLIVKYAGADYLVYLGVRILRSQDAHERLPDSAPDGSSPFWQGVLTEVLNPKTALFFLAFIPQFIDHSAPLLPQYLTLGAISVLLNTTADVSVVLAAAPLELRLRSSVSRRNRQWQASGAGLIGLGGYVAISSS